MSDQPIFKASGPHTYFTYAPAKVQTVKLGIDEDYRQQCINEIKSFGDINKRQSNVQADMSSWRIWEQSAIYNPILEEILRFGRATIDRLAGNKETLPNIINAWSAVYRKGDYTKPHSHDLSVLAFCYYLQADVQDAPLHFETMNNFYIQPESDLLVCFPCTLHHWVPEQQSENERIVIAGNFGYD